MEHRLGGCWGASLATVLLPIASVYWLMGFLVRIDEGLTEVLWHDAVVGGVFTACFILLRRSPSEDAEGRDRWFDRTVAAAVLVWTTTAGVPAAWHAFQVHLRSGPIHPPPQPPPPLAPPAAPLPPPA